MTLPPGAVPAVVQRDRDRQRVRHHLRQPWRRRRGGVGAARRWRSTLRKRGRARYGENDTKLAQKLGQLQTVIGPITYIIHTHCVYLI